MHINGPVDWTLNLDCLRAISLLRVESASLPAHSHRLNLNHVSTRVLAPSNGRLVLGCRRNDGLPGRVEPKVGLIHQLLVKRRVHSCVIVLDC